jgi:3-hydroxyacyl-[acyl-carrier-protein] dehydratase
MNLPPDDLAAALDALPHGRQFRFVDQLRSLTPGKEGVGEYWVRGDEPFLAGHFPGEPIFPGVLVVEACAQVAGVVAQTAPRTAPFQRLKLTALHNVKILGSVRPGELMVLHASITGRMGQLVQADVECRVGERLVTKGALTLSGDTVGF